MVNENQPPASIILDPVMITNSLRLGPSSVSDAFYELTGYENTFSIRDIQHDESCRSTGKLFQIKADTALQAEVRKFNAQYLTSVLAEIGVFCVHASNHTVVIWPQEWR